MAGPKAKITAEPLDFSDYPEDGAERRIKFIEDYLITPRGHGAGEPFHLREFQKDIIRGAYAPGVRSGLVSMPRGNGKTALAAALGVADMFVGQLSAQVLVVASDLRQAMITFKLAARMIELNPLLSERVHVFKDHLEYPQNDAEFIPLPAEYDALQGYDPTLQIVDELHVVTEDVWEAVTSASGKRPESLALAISTPGTDKDSVMWRLVEHGRLGTDSAFYFKEFAAPEGCALDDRAAWHAANPALADAEPFLAEDALEAVKKTIRESRFRQLRLGQWASGSASWIDWETWAGIADPDYRLKKKQRVCLGFDGSSSGDTTALVAATVERNPHVFVLGVWERPQDDHNNEWRVPRAEVVNAFDMAFKTYNVVEAACDPWGWNATLQDLADKHGARKVVEFNTGFRKRMAPLTDAFYELVQEGRLSHDGHERLAVHVSNAVATETPQGTVITKDSRKSKRKIDLAVAAIIAVGRAQHYARRGSKVEVF